MAKYIAVISRNEIPTSKRFSNNNPNIIFAKVDSDPNINDGTHAPVGSIVVDPNSIYYYKIGEGPTAWSRLFESRVHLPIVAPDKASGPVGQLPPINAFGSLAYITFDGPAGNQSVYRTIKLPETYLGNASFHIHWTKSDDQNRLGESVKWKISYSVFNGRDQSTEEFFGVEYASDTYDDAGLGSRVIFRTQDYDVPLLTPGYYVSLKVEKDSPEGSAMDAPGLVSIDFVYSDGLINPQG